MDLINKRSLRKSIPDIKAGDVVKVSQKIIEGAKTRVQIFEGMVIERSGGNGVAASITVRKIASGVGVEKKFLLNSPNIESVKVLRSSKVRRKKIFFLRGLTGKAAKIKERQRKMLSEIGLKEDEVVETAETTEELAPIPVEEAEQENKEAINQEDKEEIKEEVEEIKTEEPTVEVESNEKEVVSDEAVEQKVEEIAETEAPIEEKIEEPKTEEIAVENVEANGSSSEKVEELIVENTNEEKTE